MQLHNCLLSYDFLTLLLFWNKVHVHIDRIQKRLQDPSMNLDDSALNLKASEIMLIMKEKCWSVNHSKKDSVFVRNEILKLKDVRALKNEWQMRIRETLG